MVSVTPDPGIAQAQALGGLGVVQFAPLLASSHHLLRKWVDQFSRTGGEMQTTSLLVELVVIGVCACSWVFPLLSSIVSPTTIGKFLTASNLSFIVGMSALYFIGMFTNFVADLTLRWLDERVGRKFGGKSKLQRQRANIFLKSKKLRTTSFNDVV